jgi:hypothetical protein
VPRPPGFCAMAGKPGVVPSEPPSAVGVVTLRGSSGAGRLPPVLLLRIPKDRNMLEASYFCNSESRSR